MCLKISEEFVLDKTVADYRKWRINSLHSEHSLQVCRGDEETRTEDGGPPTTGPSAEYNSGFINKNYVKRLE